MEIIRRKRADRRTSNRLASDSSEQDSSESKRPASRGRKFSRSRPQSRNRPSSHKRPIRKPASKTAWQPFGGWYDSLVGEEGHYYHREVIIPGLFKLLDIKSKDSFLDLACGQGILARAFSDKNVCYTGVDASAQLIEQAKERSSKASFIVADISKPLTLPNTQYDHIVIVLAIQNIEDQAGVLENCSKYLKPGGKLVLVLNHPCFRIPRQSSWGVDEAAQIQYRRLNRYLSPMPVPMKVHPSKQENSPVMWAYHQPISFYVNSLAQSGLYVSGMEEWVSPKTSFGKVGRRENRARKEFPLFMALVATKPQ